MDRRLELLERLKLTLNGYVYVGERSKEGWRGSLPHYVFNCPVHGLVENYPHGYDERLECPICSREKKVLEPLTA